MLKTQEDINKDLADSETNESEFQKKVLEYVRPLIKAGSDRMCSYHDSWDNYDWIYRGYRIADRDDKDARAANEPPKIIVPITYAQVQTALSFLMSSFLQRDHFYELRGVGPEDEKGKFALEEDIAYQMTRNGWALKLYGWLLDPLKYGFGVVKGDWTEDYCRMRVRKQVPVKSFTNMINNFMGGMFGQAQQQSFEFVESVEDVLSYQGNRFRNISPYSFFPDPDLPIAKFMEGSFVVHEEERSRTDLERDSKYFGVSKIPSTMTKELYDTRRRRAGRSFADSGVADMKSINGSDKNKDAVVLTEIQIVMSGKEVKERFGADLDNTTYPQKWVVAIGNDQKVIQFVPLGCLHGEFSYNVIEFSPDHNAFFNPGLSETIYELQNMITFLLNSHIVNVRKIVANRLVFNPEYINSSDLASNQPHIRTKGQPPGDISRVLQQLDVSDITKNHITDLNGVLALVQVITGINENALGQYSSGRRSATEARNVNAGAAARLKMFATNAWIQGIEPLGRQILANTRQGRTPEVYKQIVGNRAVDAPFETTILADPNKIAGGYDFIPYDATLPSDRQQQAGLLTELFTALVSNPNTLQLLQKDPTKLLKYIAELHGLKNLDELNLDAPQPLVPPNAQVVPDAQAGEAAAAGATPVDFNATNLLQQLAAG